MVSAWTEQLTGNEDWRPTADAGRDSIDAEPEADTRSPGGVTYVSAVVKRASAAISPALEGSHPLVHKAGRQLSVGLRPRVSECQLAPSLGSRHGWPACLSQGMDTTAQ